MKTKKTELEQAYIDRQNYQRENKRNPISLKRQKELLKKYPDGLIGMDYLEGKITNEENSFLMFDLICNKYGKSMSITEFYGMLNKDITV